MFVLAETSAARLCEGDFGLARARREHARGIAMAGVGLGCLRLPRGLVEPRGIEPLTFALRKRRNHPQPIA
jgi:hypothetical protein